MSYATTTAGPSRPLDFSSPPPSHSHGHTHDLAPLPPPKLTGGAGGMGGSPMSSPVAGPAYASPGVSVLSAGPVPSPGYSPAPPSLPRSDSAIGSADGHGHGSEGEAARRNPLVDLIDSERTYVEQLALVIRRVAAAWSRRDFPPPKLDSMFRCIEAVYRANRAFGTKLKDIGPSPSSPKALGDLLMRWIDDLEPAYHKFATSFLSGFDTYPSVTRNTLLPGILVDISSSVPPPAPLQTWTLDALFLLPYSRLKYYRKLYARLLRSTKEGRSDHRLLVVANQRLEALVGRVEARLELDVSDGEPDSPDTPSGAGAGAGAGSGAGAVGGDGQSGARAPQGEYQGTQRTSAASSSVHAAGIRSGEQSREPSWAEKDQNGERRSGSSSGMGSSRGSQTTFSPFSSRIEDRNSGASAATSLNQSPQRRPPTGMSVGAGAPSVPAKSQMAVAPLSDLELRIDTERAVDLFSMTLKKCKLQMNPPSLPYTRALRSSHDVVMTFTPKSTGQTVTHRRAHVFVLSDLFLVAEWMDASDKAARAQQVAREQPERVGKGGPMPEMWLCYPPLAGKHLQLAEGSQANVLMVTVMRKETFVIHAENEIARDQLVKDLTECIDFATNLSRKATGLTSPTIDTRSPSAFSDGRSVSQESTFPPLRYPSPFSAQSSPSVSPRPPDMYDASGGGGPDTMSTVPQPQPQPPSTITGNALVSQMSQLNLQPGETIQWNRRPSLPLAHGPPPPAKSLLGQGHGGPPVSYTPQQPGSSASASASLPPGAGTGAGGVLPPRGVSLRTRQTSLNVPLGSMAGGGGGGPIPPNQPFTNHASQSDPQIARSIPRSPSGRSVISNPRSDGGGGSGPPRVPVPMPTIRAPSAPIPGQGQGNYGPGSHLSDPNLAPHVAAAGYGYPPQPPHPAQPGAPHPGPSRSKSADPLRPITTDPAAHRPPLHLNTNVGLGRPGGPPVGAGAHGYGQLQIDPLAPPRRPNPDGLGPAIQSPSARFSSFHLPGEGGADGPGGGGGGAGGSAASSRPASPPHSPVDEDEEDPGVLTGPAIISAQMKCKVFLQQSHQQWKALGSAKLKLYVQKERNVKQLVVESEGGKGGMLISTIVLTDGVERVAKTGVAVEISDRGQRTGIIYMIQLRNEGSAAGLFGSLLKGSDRDPAR